ncbi:MAG: AbrB/MazE/SpoVT family DNA-binding domain-containing protein [Kiritimatiellae bacterium]|nr:AbrB/MazE/SpoVT family DNA-binding domain-containing protein [Kiritimatiellia bacterium]MDD4623173.1 AbrB/MazE/SpoVT family DNA-binding domain-containing protein [Kiritimatiellia bacterium]
MLAKLTSKNQLTLPKNIVAQFPEVRYFSVEAEYGRIILEPVNLQPLSAVREKMEQLGISEADIGKAVAWSRKQK